jgi:hypothetical protein
VPATPAPHSRDPRPLADAITGSWTSGLMNLTFSPDGNVAVTILGTVRNGRWSVDGAGRLRADITGGPETADAWVAGNQLTVAVEGTELTFTRERGA